MTSQTNESPELNSRPSTPYFDFNYPGWLDLVDGVDVSRVCRPVERVYPYYRARPGPQEGNLVSGELSVLPFMVRLRRITSETKLLTFV